MRQHGQHVSSVSTSFYKWWSKGGRKKKKKEGEALKLASAARVEVALLNASVLQRSAFLPFKGAPFLPFLPLERTKSFHFEL